MQNADTLSNFACVWQTPAYAVTYRLITPTPPMDFNFVRAFRCGAFCSFSKACTSFFLASGNRFRVYETSASHILSMMYFAHRPAKQRKTSSAPPSLISRRRDECSWLASHVPSSFLFSSVSDDNCRLSEYRRLKGKMLDLYDKRYTSYNIRGAHKDNMAVRKQLVDVMFKRFDADADGRVKAGEISQVRLLGRKTEGEVKKNVTSWRRLPEFISCGDERQMCQKYSDSLSK